MGKPEKRLFIISNPTHYINAKTYIKTHNPAENFVILTITYFNGYQEFYERVKKDSEIKLLMVIYNDQNISSHKYYYGILINILKIKSLRRFPKINQILFTNYESWIQHYILKQFNCKKLILISDGTAIFNISEKRKFTKEIPFKGSKYFRNFLGLSPIQNLIFYSPIKVDIDADDTLEIFKYNSSETSQINYNKIFVVGSPLLELKFLNEEKNIFYLKKIREKYSNEQIIYFAHRREKEENLNSYVFFDRIIRDTITFEERMQQEEELPLMVISLISSILINLPQVFPQIEFKYIPLIETDFLSIDQLKKYMEVRNNLEKINLPNLNPFK